MIGMSVHAVLYSLLSRHRIVLLKENDGDRYLPIWIGSNEAEAIAMRLQGGTVPRPLTHDLLASMISELGGAVQHIVVNDLRNNTFYARIAIEQDGQLKLVDSRPSDAIALAVRIEVPIYAEEGVMEKAGILPSPDIREEMERTTGEDLDVFRDFVDGLDLGDLEED